MKKHSKALVFFAVSKQILIVYSADRGRAETRNKGAGKRSIGVYYNFWLACCTKTVDIYENNLHIDTLHKRSVFNLFLTLVQSFYMHTSYSLLLCVTCVILHL